MLQAARLLADAWVDIIRWNGTSAGWLGLDRDRDLGAAITAGTNAPAASSVLALVDVFRLTGIKRFGLVTPDRGEVQERIAANFEREGFACAAERHLDISDNFAFSEVESRDGGALGGRSAVAPDLNSTPARVERFPALFSLLQR